LPLVEQANVGGFVLPFANPRLQHEYRVLQNFRSPTGKQRLRAEDGDD
jgi:hypothetical protein